MQKQKHNIIITQLQTHIINKLTNTTRSGSSKGGSRKPPPNCVLPIVKTAATCPFIADGAPQGRDEPLLPRSGVIGEDPTNLPVIATAPLVHQPSRPRTLELPDIPSLYPSRTHRLQQRPEHTAMPKPTISRGQRPVDALGRKAKAPAENPLTQPFLRRSHLLLIFSLYYYY